MIRRILLATDFSTRSDRALRRAILLAKKEGATLTMVHVVDGDGPEHFVRSQIESARTMLEETARTIETHDRVPAYAMVVTGDAHDGIVHAAEELGADLVVVGSHRRQLRDLFIGTTAQRSIARIARPVLMVGGVPASHYDRALIALDMDEASEAIARRIGALRTLGAAEIVALHAYDAPARLMLARAMTGAGAIDGYVRSEGARASEHFGRFLATAGLATARHRSVPLKGTPARTIVECAGDEAASLIVVGSSRRKGIERMFLGSVAEDVVGNADRDVLVVPA